MLARQWLVNALIDVPRSVWYDAVDAPGNASMRESHFGTLRAPYNSPAQPHQPKPAFLAATTLQRVLSCASSLQRVDVTLPGNSSTDPNAYALVFTTNASLIGTSEVVAVWKVDGHEVGKCEDVGIHSKVDCGYKGIDEATCEARGCCFETP